jgi:uncharacterized tellurite resistance protein B-like protein
MLPQEIEAFAEGLYRLATVDGVHEAEVKIIREFLEEAGAAEKLEGLGKTDFDASQLPWALRTEHMRRVFLKTCWALVKSDHEVTDKERALIGEYAEHLGLETMLSAIEASAVDAAL